jgi:hypothetical protein
MPDAAIHLTGLSSKTASLDKTPFKNIAYLLSWIASFLAMTLAEGFLKAENLR